MKHYTQLTQEERYQISALLKAQHDQTEIAMIMGRHKSTISREIRRNTGLRGYRPKQAQCLAEQRRHARVRSRICADVWLMVEQLISLDWSPEQVSLWLKAFCGMSISHEWIYLYIYQDKAHGGELYEHPVSYTHLRAHETNDLISYAVFCL